MPWKKTSKILAGAGMLAVLLSSATSFAADKLTIATVNNADMIIMQRLSKDFEKESGITLDWVVLEENVLRQRVTTDIATNGGQFDVMTIGTYEAPIWAAQDWLLPIDNLPADYALDDVLKPVRDGLSHDGKLYALPFYAESSMTYYRKDLFDKAGLKMPDQPTYDQIKEFAAKLHDPSHDLYGICLRGKPGWGENMAFFDPLVNTYGGRWFDMDWKPTIDTPAWHEALTYYVDLLKNYGPPGAPSNGYNENRALFSSGKCAIWIDATSAAGSLYDPKDSTVADKVAFAQAPIAKSPKGNHWLWSWALAVPKSTKSPDAAKKFIAWATSKAYIESVGKTAGWTLLPPGTRSSTYANPEYQKAAPFAAFVLKAIQTADPTDSTVDKVPYTGVQFVGIPEFQAIGTEVGQQIAAALAGSTSIDQALKASQDAADRAITQGGYK
jgi:sorbitol/mannitol transport system substrate-binding protein